MNNQFRYPVKLTKQKEGGYLVQFPDLPEAITQGDDMEDSLNQAMDCLEEAIAYRITNRLEIPAPSQKKRSKYVSLPTTFAVKLALYLAMKESRTTNMSLALKLDCDEKEIRRLLDPHYPSKLPRIEQALNQLGKRLQVEIVSY
ncbi:MAG TPA: type II toxin-antitoxin system HicB family antitoxin [Gammaproteobacteria bacterium]|nr:type II toxin-antitoxin system HicB family antitoxin [Gammaproteobacteria bacterium]